MQLNNDTYALVGLIVLGIASVMTKQTELAIFCAGAIGGYIGATKKVV